MRKKRKAKHEPDQSDVSVQEDVCAIGRPSGISIARWLLQSAGQLAKVDLAEQSLVDWLVVVVVLGENVAVVGI